MRLRQDELETHLLASPAASWKKPPILRVLPRHGPRRRVMEDRMKFVLRFSLLAACAVIGVMTAAYIAIMLPSTNENGARQSPGVGRNDATSQAIELQQPVVHDPRPLQAARIRRRCRRLRWFSRPSSRRRPSGSSGREPPVAAQPMAVEPNSAQESPPGPRLAGKPPRSQLRLAARSCSPLDGVLPSDPQSRDVMFDMLQQMLQNPEQMKKVLQGAGGSAESVESNHEVAARRGSAAGDDDAQASRPAPEGADSLPPRPRPSNQENKAMTRPRSASQSQHIAAAWPCRRRRQPPDGEYPGRGYSHRARDAQRAGGLEHPGQRQRAGQRVGRAQRRRCECGAGRDSQIHRLRGPARGQVHLRGDAAGFRGHEDLAQIPSAPGYFGPITCRPKSWRR